MKNQSGITLVALVITIIVLLILAGVSINLALGQNGVLTRASSAVSANERAKVLEELGMSVNESQTVYFTEMINQATYRKSTPFYDDKDSNGKFDVFEHNCMSAESVTLDPATDENPSNDAIITGVYESNGSGLYYGFKIDVKTGEVKLVDKGVEEFDDAKTASAAL